MRQSIRFLGSRYTLAGLCLMVSQATVEAMTGEDLVAQCGTNRSLIAGYVAGSYDTGVVDSDVLVRFYFDTFDARQAPERLERDKRAYIKSSLAIDSYCIPIVVE